MFKGFFKPVDIYSKKKRSEIMSLVKSKNTSPERLVFSYLRKRGVYFQRHYTRVPGCPDVALPKKKIAIFIDGDFWHGRKFNKRKAKLSQYWSKKISGNIKRDKKNRSALKKMNWSVLRVWETDLKQEKSAALNKIETFLLT